MKDFKSYSNDGGKEQNNTAQSAQNGAKSGELNSAVELAKVLSSAMNGKSEGQIFSYIIAEAERGKREGTLSNNDLDNFFNAVSPLVDGFKRQKLKQIITKLKSI